MGTSKLFDLIRFPKLSYDRNILSTLVVQYSTTKCSTSQLDIFIYLTSLNIWTTDESQIRKRYLWFERLRSLWCPRLDRSSSIVISSNDGWVINEISTLNIANVVNVVSPGQYLIQSSMDQSHCRFTCGKGRVPTCRNPSWMFHVIGIRSIRSGVPEF